VQSITDHLIDRMKIVGNERPESFYGHVGYKRWDATAATKRPKPQALSR
jgi:hypothetical protein